MNDDLLWKIAESNERIQAEIGFLRAEVRELTQVVAHRSARAEPRIFERWMLIIIVALLVYAIFFRH